MANEFDAAKADGIFKSVQKEWVNVKNESSILQKLLPFDQDAKVGRNYEVDVEIKAPQGWTHTGNASTVTALKGARNGIFLTATAVSYESILREQVQYKVINQAQSKGDTAFKKASSAIAEAMQNSALNRQEALLLHGQRGLFEVESVADGGSSTAVLTITAATWSTGLAYSLIGAALDAVTSGTTVNNGAGGAGVALVVTKVDVANRAITVTHGGTYSDQVAAGDILNFEGAGVTASPVEPVGILAQAGNTSSAMFGITPTTAGYGNWAGNTYAMGGPVSFEKIEDMVTSVRARAGDKAGKLVCLIGRGYGTLRSQLAEAGRISLEASAKAITNGVKSMKYDAGMELGDFDITYHPFMRDGEVVVFPVQHTVRSGATDISYGLPGSDGEKFFQFIAGYNAFELQTLFDIYLMVKKPSAAILGTGITFS